MQREDLVDNEKKKLAIIKKKKNSLLLKKKKFNKHDDKIIYPYNNNQYSNWNVVCIIYTLWATIDPL